MELRFCFWGGELGARLADDADLVDQPETDSPWKPAAPDGPVGGDADVDPLWALLDEDPLFELRVIAAGEAPPNCTPHRMPPGKTLEARARDLPGNAIQPAEVPDKIAADPVEVLWLFALDWML